MRSYTFNEWVTSAGLTRNEGKNLLQTGTIQPDIKSTTGTGDHRTFGFLDVFEARVASELKRIPGGMPTAALSVALQAIRFETESSQLTPWGLFLDPQTRDPGARFWLCWFPFTVPCVLDSEARDTLLNERTDVVVMLRLDNLLIELEQKTQDHASASERGEPPTTRRHGIDGPGGEIEEALSRELVKAGFSSAQIETACRQLHENLEARPPERRLLATFMRYVEMIDAIVKIHGPDANDEHWRKRVVSFTKTWRNNRKPLVHQIMHLIEARESIEVPPRQKNAR